MKKICKNCALWEEESYCSIKPFFTNTDGDYMCDETTFKGESYFIAKQKE